MLNIAIDAMGGDYGPDISVPGTIKALIENPDIQANIFGNKGKIETILSNKNIKEDIYSRINIFHTNDKDNIPMNVAVDHRLIKKYPNSSMLSSINNVDNGDSDVLVSAGNTGALTILSLLRFKRIKSIATISLAAMFPDKNGLKETLVLDLGADKDVSAKKILHNSIIGTLYVKNTEQIEKPKIGLLNIGEESNKGRKVDIEAYKLLEKCSLINFKGNIESNKLLNNDCDAIIVDGYTGNNVLKMGEGTKEAIFYIMKRKIDIKAEKFMIPKIIRKFLLSNFDKLSTSNDGGAMLLGINKPVVKAHGGTSIEAFSNSIGIAYKYAKSNVIKDIKNELEKLKLY